MGSKLYPQAKKSVKSDYNAGVLEVYDESGNVIYKVDPVNRRVEFPSGAGLRVAGDDLEDVRYVEKLISDTEAVALYTTPITVVPAVGTGNYFQFLGAHVFLDYATTAYVCGVGYDLVFQNLSAGDKQSHTLDGSLFQATADMLALALPIGEDESDIKDLVANGGTEVTVEVGNWTTGDSPLKIRCYYRIIPKTDMEGIT